MANRFKFRISRLVSCFHSRRSSKSSLPSNPKPHLSSLRPHVSSALISVARGVRPTPTLSLHNDTLTTPTTPRRKIYNSPASGASALDDDASPPPPPKRRVKKKKTTTPRGRIRIRNRFSTSSADHRYDKEESEALVSSSRHFSTGSTKVKQKKGVSSPERTTEWRLEGKLTDSMAVEKMSEDPYEDFRKSMMEMILEKQIFEEEELEQLLYCFLSLNSTRHHGIIVQAFTDIWEAALFC